MTDPQAPWPPVPARHTTGPVKLTPTVATPFQFKVATVAGIVAVTVSLVMLAGYLIGGMH